MTTAIVGVAGVLLGGILNALGGHLLARRRELRETTRAARILLPELLRNGSALGTAQALKRWQFAEFQTERWQECRLQLASGLGDEWQHLTAVYTAFELLNADREWREAASELDDPDDLEYILLTQNEMEHAVAVLRSATRLSPDAVLAIPEFYGV